MTKNTSPYLRNDLNKRTNISDVFFFNDISFQSCIVILSVFAVLLLSVLFIAGDPNPNISFGV